jgi:arylsulfatase A-like enzyme
MSAVPRLSRSGFRLVLLALALAPGCAGTPLWKGRPPNILLIVMDAARADHLSAYGYGRPTTPNLDRMAAEGLLFTRAVSSSSWTVPAHASLFTGLLPYENGAHARHTWLIERFPTLAQLLKRKGYRTAGFSNNPMVDERENLSRGFDAFTAVWADSTRVTPRRPHNTEYTNALVRGFLEARDDKGAPFFIFINYMDAHSPYEPPEPFRSRFLDAGGYSAARVDSASHYPALVNGGELRLAPEDYRALSDLYDGGLAYLDSKIGELLDYLRQRDLYDNTLVIVLGDHGEMFGEHGMLTHGLLLYRNLVRIPLIVRCPRLIPEPGVREDLVSITDIFHTLVRITGAEGAAVSGSPVSDLIEGGPAGRACYSEIRASRLDEGPLARANDTRSVWLPSGRHYILTESEAWECYAVDSDPLEMQNLCPGTVTREEVAAAVSGFEIGLVPFKETLDDLKSSRRVMLDRQQEAAVRAIGYVAGPAPGSGGLSYHGQQHYNNGLYYYNLGQTDPAREEIRKALVIDPDFVTAHVTLGEILINGRKYGEALKYFQDLSRRFAGEVRIQRHLVVLLAVAGRAGEAGRVFDGLAQADPGETSAYFSGQGEMFLRNRSPGPAAVLFDLLRRRFPSDKACAAGYARASALLEKSGAGR